MKSHCVELSLSSSAHTDKNWSQEDRDKEKKLMDELVTIIEQRNQIISCLDQDRQRYLREKNHLCFCICTFYLSATLFF